MLQEAADSFDLAIIELMVKNKFCQFLKSKIQVQVGGMAADLIIEGFTHTVLPPQNQTG